MSLCMLKLEKGIAYKGGTYLVCLLRLLREFPGEKERSSINIVYDARTITSAKKVNLRNQTDKHYFKLNGWL